MIRTHRTIARRFPEHPGHLAVALSLLMSLAFAFSLLGAASAFAITRDSVLARAQEWVDHPVPYSQAKKHAGYRTDCSGYVSACWATKTSWSTRSFYKVSRRISASQLQPGDALLKKGYHIRLFYGWLDEAHTSYVAYEAGTVVAICRVHSLADDVGFGYVPTRYNHIAKSPLPSNLLHNGAFDVWAQSWGEQDQQPVWWQVNGVWWQGLAVRRTDIYRSGHSSLELVNPGNDPATFTELAQTTPVRAGLTYRLSAWARTAADPATLELAVTYLDAAGTTLPDAGATSRPWNVRGASFKWMSVAATAPPNAVRAVAAVRLAGGTTTGATGGVANGSSVMLDDISLVQPQATVTIKTSAATAHSGRTVVLSGVVAPSSAVGVRATVWVQRPGSGWKQLSAVQVRASGKTATWQRSVVFTKGMRKGVYLFKATVPPFRGYLGSTTRTASVGMK